MSSANVLISEVVLVYSKEGRGIRCDFHLPFYVKFLVCSVAQHVVFEIQRPLCVRKFFGSSSLRPPVCGGLFPGYGSSLKFLESRTSAFGEHDNELLCLVVLYVGLARIFTDISAIISLVDVFGRWLIQFSGFLVVCMSINLPLLPSWTDTHIPSTCDLGLLLWVGWRILDLMAGISAMRHCRKDLMSPALNPASLWNLKHKLLLVMRNSCRRRPLRCYGAPNLFYGTLAVGVEAWTQNQTVPKMRWTHRQTHEKFLI